MSSKVAYKHRSDVFVSNNDICYNYGDFSISILPSILSKSTYFVKIQTLLNNCICLTNILSSEWLDKQIRLGKQISN